MTNLYDFIRSCVVIKNSSLCIGLDPENEKLPAKFKNSATPYFDFNREIIDATFDLACAYKPQFAHYAAFGRENELELTINYIKEKSNHLLIILDSKRGDIGNTASYYAKESFNRYGATTVTINPYMGFDSAEPFLNDPSLGVFILCRTSNASGSDFQNLITKENNIPLYQEVAKKVFTTWNYNNNCGLVLGATFPKELEEVRKLVGPEIPFLVPGVGSQGGNVNNVIKAGYSKPGSILINSSRGVIHKDLTDNFALAARKEAELLRNEINHAIAATASSKYS